jgi:hypothetical protein
MKVGYLRGLPTRISQEDGQSVNLVILARKSPTLSLASYGAAIPTNSSFYNVDHTYFKFP